jgi:AcrR family transcriptional regulator
MVVRSPAAATGAEGLRERKKALTRQRLTDAATRMFLARGFDAVRVTEIAAACDVSEKTVYNYFPTKESLILDRWDGTARALRAGLADAGVHPVDAVRGILADELAALTSWLDSQDDTAAAIGSVRRFGELIATTPALRAYHNDTMNELVTVTSGLLAERVDLNADSRWPRPRISRRDRRGSCGCRIRSAKAAATGYIRIPRAQRYFASMRIRARRRPKSRRPVRTRVRRPSSTMPASMLQARTMAASRRLSSLRPFR